MFVFLCAYILFPILATIFMECFPPETISGIFFFIFLYYTQYLASIYFYYIFFNTYETDLYQIEILYRLGVLSCMFLLVDILIALSIPTSYILFPVFLLNVFNIGAIIYLHTIYETDESENRSLFSANLEEKSCESNDDYRKDMYPDAEYSINSKRGNYTYKTMNLVP